MGRSCAIVLIGGQTAARKWIVFEIKQAWDKGIALLRIFTHGVTD
jgi:hypothetical protein